MSLNVLDVQDLADKVVSKIEEMGPRYNGLHLRMEKDALDWAEIMGGRDQYWQMHKQEMHEAKLDEKTILYVASGLLKASANDPWSRNEMQALTTDILDSKVCPCLLNAQR